jgi:inner membrane protein
VDGRARAVAIEGLGGRGQGTGGVDNVTHTLVGLALAESGLKGRTRFATATLLLGANLPDVDGFMYFFGSATDALAFRRGWTHGVLAMVVFPFLLTAMVLGWHRLAGRGSDSGPQRTDPGWVLALAAIGIMSHPLLDLLNTYGVRLLMPLSGRWFYGDALFILDPWLWLALGAGVILTRGRARTAPAGRASAVHRPARVALGAGAAYALVMAISSRVGVRVVEARAEGPAARRTLVSPVFLTPFRRTVVRDLGQEYEVGALRWGLPPRYERIARDPVGFDAPGVREALSTPAGAAFLTWARFPYFTAQPRSDSIEVMISDMRYGRGPSGSWASVRVTVTREGR